MIIVTGAMGFIGSNLVGYLNQLGHQNLIVVDDFYKWKKEKNLEGKRIREWVHRDLFIPYFEKAAAQVDVVFHLGARTDTISEDTKIFDALNVKYSKDIWEICARQGIPLIYASSAATYGNGQLGFSDDHDTIPKLQPLNAYAHSKQEFDLWALSQENTPPNWYGLKFFNVYGPNESHKGRMASVIYHAFHQIRETSKLRLFKSHHPEFNDGGQLRDFIYVKDVLEMIMDVYKKLPGSGIYNVGTGKSRTFEDLGKACFKSLKTHADIEYFDIPEDLKDKYQYFTEAAMNKWISSDLTLPGTTLENGIKDYIQRYLLPGKIF
ncbi:MAG TPA: ADP-glyceromanno-heptose 6-epimerase [Saprospiraceae bacterium]|nr:ADP-glyceromanno-heptose 6-epimerase [Saprospiraceae bacterium]